MILSMTGFGRAKAEKNGKSYTIEIKTLNGKQADLRLKAPAYLRTKEISLRKVIMDDIKRGKADCSILIQSSDRDTDYTLNTALIDNYYRQLSQIGERHGLKGQDYLQTIIRIPNVVQPNDEEVSEEEWDSLLTLVKKALDDLREFRTNEGHSMYEDLRARVNKISSLLSEVEGHEDARNDTLKSKLNRLLEEASLPEKVDANRLEQEIIYYLEKLDIHEEKVRLKQHCEYFLTIIQNEEVATGKKLGFISQEMGREINTLGSKAQYSPLQQIVVQMKVELDQIKEQLANVL